MAETETPMSLRLGGTTSSSSLRPSTHQQSTTNSGTNTPLAQQEQLGHQSSLNNLKQPQGAIMPASNGQQANYTGRFPSAYYPNMNAVQAESSSSAQTQQNQAEGSSAPRSRSSTFGQGYPSTIVQVPPMPVSPPFAHAQPLFAQHSGASGHVQQSSLVSNRPLSTVQSPQTPPTGQSIYQNGPSIPHSTTTTRPSSSQVANTKSPFTTPITSPPRNRPNQILVVNPTSTTALTNTILNTLRPILPHALEVTAYTPSYPAPTAIESTTDSILSTETCLRDLAKHSTNNGETVQNFDALLVCSYNKHPLVDSLRECYDVPVIGIMEASLYVARMLGARFGIITPTTRSKVMIDDAVAAYGLSHFFVGVDSLHISNLDLISHPAITSTATTTTSPTTNPATPPTQPNQKSTETPSSQTASQAQKVKEELTKRLTHVSKILVAKGADTIILGSEFLSNADHIRIIKDAVRDEDGRRTVNVIDAVEAGVMMLNGLVGMGVPTSKRGVYRNEREGRRVRGQAWL